MSWIDNQGNLRLFGGYGADSVGSTGALNDLWKYQQATPAQPDFSIAASPESLIVPAGRGDIVAITVTPVKVQRRGLVQLLGVAFREIMQLFSRNYYTAARAGIDYAYRSRIHCDGDRRPQLRRNVCSG